MTNWRDLLVPGDAAALWTAASAVATAVAAWFTYKAVVYASRGLTLEHQPAVWLDRQMGNHAVLRNSGRGIAYTVVVADDQKVFQASVSVISPGDTVRVPGQIGADAFYIYAQDGLNRWWLTRAVYDGLVWTDGSGFTNRYLGSVGAWRVPSNVKRRLQRDAESSGDIWRSFASPLGKRWWTSRFTKVWNAIRIDLPRRLEALPERVRVNRFGSRPLTVTAAPTDEERLTWAIDVTGLAQCWKGERSIRQKTCERDAATGDLFCEVEVALVAAPPIRGLLRITSAAYERLPRERTERIKEIARRFDAYICRLRPKKLFVFSLRTYGPFLINWP